MCACAHALASHSCGPVGPVVGRGPWFGDLCCRKQKNSLRTGEGRRKERENVGLAPVDQNLGTVSSFNQSKSSQRDLVAQPGSVYTREKCFLTGWHNGPLSKRRDQAVQNTNENRQDLY